MPKFAIISDLHLEFYEGRLPTLNFGDAEMLLNAGDTHPKKMMRDAVKKYLEDIPQIEVLGNHDYYGSNFPKNNEGITQIVFNGLKIAACTLWTPIIGDYDWFYFQGCMTDSHRIKGMTRKSLTSKHFHDLNYLNSLKPDVVVTHHSPSIRSCSANYLDHPANRFFHNDMEHVILDIKPKLWVHGHTHTPCWYYIGDTLVVCNPRGYPSEQKVPYGAVILDTDNLPSKKFVLTNPIENVRLLT